jgi:hypothetical protein
MKLMTIALAAAIGTGVWARGVVPPTPVVTVCMENLADFTTFYLAQREASEIFFEVGVNIAWKSGRACDADGVIHIHFSDHTEPNVQPDALAAAHLNQKNYIEVFYDRVALVSPATLPHLLAHVLVHEITHILQGIARHSETGIMKAHWTSRDYRAMSIHHLQFAPEDVQLLQSATKNLAERLQIHTATPVLVESRIESR